MKPYSYNADFFDPSLWDLRADPLVEPRDVESDDSDDSDRDFIPPPWTVCDDDDLEILF